MVLLKPSAFSKSPKPRPQQGGVSDSLIGDTVEEADAFISQWVSPHLHDSSSTSCSLSSLFSAENRGEGRRFLDVLAKLHYAIQSAGLVNPDSAKLSQARDLMQTAMKYLEKEFYRVLKSNRRFLNPEFISNEKAEGDADADSDAIEDLKMIANCMISSGYEKDCVKIYKKLRKKIILEALSNLGFEKLTSAQMQKLECEILEKKIKGWVRLARVAFVTLFKGERILCDRIFFSSSSSSSSVSLAESTFVEITLQSALKLFVFPITIVKCRKTVEKIFPTLDVYQTILHVIPNIDQIFSYDSTASVRSQAAESLEKLGESVNAMMIEFQSSITKESSKSPIPGGGVHQLTRYVMNFIVFLADYSDSLAAIIKDKESSLPLPEDYYNNKNNNEENPENAGSPMAARLAWLILVLLCKIDAKSRLYSDAALSYLFLANNLHYVITKVRTSNLKEVLGDDWVAKQEVKVTQYLEKYEKMAWGDVVVSVPGDSTEAEKADEALKRFNEAFEEAYKKHKTWVVPDPKLRDEIKASIAGKIMAGYTGFYKKYPVGSSKIVRFTPEDLNSYISDLYIGLRGSVPVSTN
ncbi:unnamed protein product [Eruca vesicaria subsp. sativa]|uniref:Exocyst subunit Exo70 family protein n=1 Tax=Eruca vesicaria subsp. sativa TaxID=29727 RepID=A0ABC8LPS2_ERUVS|nr:unnamed protein product [Eruca vesicaria subsp. sativa]